MLSLLFFLICYSTSILLIVGGCQPETTTWPSDLEFPVFLSCAIADIVLIILFVFVEVRFFKNRVNIPLIILLSCLFVINLIVIVTTPLENTFEYVYLEEPGTKIVTITNEWKVMYVLCFVILLLNIYISFNYMIFRVQFKKQFAWICILGIIIGFFLLIYSYVTEYETYQLFLENISTTVRTYNPQSLTNNTNSFAAILLGAGFCSYSMYAVTKKHIFWIIGLFFCMNTLFPMSRICLALSLALTLMIFGYKMIISWKGHAFRNLNLIFLVATTLAVLVLMCMNVTEIKEYIETVIMTNDSSINSRTPLWSLTMSMTQDWHRYIGNGHGYFNTAFSVILNGELKMPHNLYIQTYGALGILGDVLLGCLILFALYKIIRLYKNNREASLISIIGLATILVYYLVEG